MAKNQLTIEILTKSININETVRDIKQKLESIQTSYDKAMSGFKNDGDFSRGLKRLRDDIAEGTKPAEQLQSQFDNLQNSLIPTNEQIKEMQENLAKIKEQMALIEAKSPNNKKLTRLENAYNLESKELETLTKTQAKYKAQLNDVKKEIKKFSDAEKENTKLVKDNSEKVKENAASLYQLNAAMTISKQLLKAMLGILTSTADAYARNALSVKAYELTFGSLEDSAGSLTKELDSMVDTLEQFGYNRSDIQQMAVDFYSLATAVGVSKTAAVNMTSDYLRMANRISIATGETLQNVTQMISSAITTGRATGVLTGFAIDLREESIKKLAVERGLIKAENEDLSQAEMYYLRQYALTEGILQNQNLLKNSGSEYLTTQERISSQISTLKENLGELLAGPVGDAIKLINIAIMGINNVISAINKTPLKGFVSQIITFSVAMLGILATVILIRAGMSKISKLLSIMIDKTSIWGQSMFTMLKILGYAAGILASFAMIFSAQMMDTDKSLKNTNDEIDDTKDKTDDATKSVKKLKNELMGFDEINLLSKDNASSFNFDNYQSMLDDLMKQFDDSAINDYAESFAHLTDNVKEFATVFGTLTLAIQGANLGWKLANLLISRNSVEQTKNNILRQQNIIAQKQEQIESAKTTATKYGEKAANDALNRSLLWSKILLGGLGAIAGIGLSLIATSLGTAFMNSQSNMTASADGNYFPSASATIIGEKYPEVAIPLGNSPQYADMQETIANRTAERLSEMSGFNGTVNVYIGNEQIRDFAVQAVNDDLRVNYGTNLGKLARS